MGEEFPDDAGDKVGTRPPEEADLVALCRRLNELGAKYLIVGGFAAIHAGYPRMTEDLDLVVDTSPENEARVFSAMTILADQAVLELEPGDVAKHNVCRVNDEITVDLMHAACGIDYAEAAPHIVFREVQGVPIPFASPLLLWRMKKPLKRAKDIPDLQFLHRLLTAQGITPPE